MAEWEFVDEDSGGPTVATGDVQGQEITINKFFIEDGDVKETAEGVEIQQDDLDALREEIDTSVDEAVKELEKSGEVSGVDLDVEPATGEADDQQDSEDEEAADEPSADAVEAARSVVEEYGITTQDYPTFVSEMQDLGFDRDPATEAWHELRDRDEIPGAEGKVVQSDSGDGGGDADEEAGLPDLEDAEPEEEPEPDLEGAAQPAAEGELSAADFVPELEPDDIDNAYLILERGSETGGAAAEQFKEYIDAGAIEMADKFSSPAAKTIMDRIDVTTPSLVVELDRDWDDTDEDRYQVVGFEQEGVDWADAGGGEEEESEEGDEGGMEGLAEEDIEIPVGADMVLINQEGAASEKVLDAIGDAVRSNEVLAFPVSSDVGEFLLEPLPDGVELPAYLTATEEGIVQEPLEELIREYS